MTIDHRRPSIAFAIVALLCAFVIGTAPGIPRAGDIGDLATGVGPFEGLLPLDGPVDSFGGDLVRVEKPDVGAAAEATALEPTTADVVPVAEAAPAEQDVAAGIALVPDRTGGDGTRSPSTGDGDRADRDGDRADRGGDQHHQAGPSTASGGGNDHGEGATTPGQGHSSAPARAHGPKVKAAKPGKSGSHAQGHASQKRTPPTKAGHQRKAGHQVKATHQPKASRQGKGRALAKGHRAGKASKAKGPQRGRGRGRR